MLILQSWMKCVANTCAKIVTHLYSICNFLMMRFNIFFVNLWKSSSLKCFNYKMTFFSSKFILLLGCYFNYFSIEILEPSFNLVLEVMHQKMPCVLQGALKLPCVHYGLLESNKKVDYSFLICLLPFPFIPLKNVCFLIKF